MPLLADWTNGSPEIKRCSKRSTASRFRCWPFFRPAPDEAIVLRDVITKGTSHRAENRRPLAIDRGRQRTAMQ